MHHGSPPPNDLLSSFVSSSLEALVHELLFVLQVYPSETFGKVVLWGVTIHVHRHPGVVEYIRDCVAVAVPVVWQGGQLVVEVGSSQRFLMQVKLSDDTKEESTPLLHRLEGMMRDLLLSLGRLQPPLEEMTDGFQIQLIPALADCPALVQQMTAGQWYQTTIPAQPTPRLLRPLFNAQHEGISLSFQAQVNSTV
jgi:hypothetical protein